MGKHGFAFKPMPETDARRCPMAMIQYCRSLYSFLRLSDSGLFIPERSQSVLIGSVDAPDIQLGQGG